MIQMKAREQIEKFCLTNELSLKCIQKPIYKKGKAQNSKILNRKIKLILFFLFSITIISMHIYNDRISESLAVQTQNTIPFLKFVGAQCSLSNYMRQKTVTIDLNVASNTNCQLGSWSDFFVSKGCTLNKCSLSYADSSCKANSNHGLIVTKLGSVFVQNFNTAIQPYEDCTFTIRCFTNQFSNWFNVADNNILITRYQGYPGFSDNCSFACRYRALSLNSTLITVNQFSGSLNNINYKDISFSSLFSLPSTPCTNFIGWSCSAVDSSTLYTDSIQTLTNPSISLSTNNLTFKINTTLGQTLNLAIACYPPNSDYQTFSDTFSIQITCVSSYSSTIKVYWCSSSFTCSYFQQQFISSSSTNVTLLTANQLFFVGCTLTNYSLKYYLNDSAYTATSPLYINPNTGVLTANLNKQTLQTHFKIVAYQGSQQIVQRYPFLITISCGSSSTKLSLPAGFQSSQTYTISANTANPTFQFKGFVSSSSVCANLTYRLSAASTVLSITFNTTGFTITSSNSQTAAKYTATVTATASGGATFSAPITISLVYNCSMDTISMTQKAPVSYTVGQSASFSIASQFTRTYSSCSISSYSISRVTQNGNEVSVSSYSSNITLSQSGTFSISGTVTPISNYLFYIKACNTANVCSSVSKYTISLTLTAATTASSSGAKTSTTSTTTSPSLSSSQSASSSIQSASSGSATSTSSTTSGSGVTSSPSSSQSKNSGATSSGSTTSGSTTASSRTPTSSSSASDFSSSFDFSSGSSSPESTSSSSTQASSDSQQTTSTSSSSSQSGTASSASSSTTNTRKPKIAVGSFLWRLQQRQKTVSSNNPQSQIYFKQPLYIQQGLINKNGLLFITFNQDILIPDTFIEINQINNATNATIIKDIQQQFSETISLEVIPQSNYNQDDLNFTFSLKNWTKKAIFIQLRFSNPSIVSQGKNFDQMKLKILQSQYFVSDVGQVQIDPARIEGNQNHMLSSISPQFIQSQSQEQIQKMSNFAQSTSQAIIGIQLGSQIFLRASISALQKLFLNMQIQKSLPIYQTVFEPQSQTYLDILGSIVDFKFLKPNSLLQLYDKNLTVEQIFSMPSQELPANMQRLGLESDNILMNISPFIVLIGFYLVIVSLLLLLLLIPKVKEAVKNLLVSQYEALRWGGVLRTLTFSYLSIGISLSAKIQYCIKKNCFAQTFQNQIQNFIQWIGIGLLLISLPIFSFIKLYNNQDQFEIEQFKIRYGILLEGIRYKRPISLLYYPMMILNRMIFSLFPLIFFNFPGIQIVCLVLWTGFYILCIMMIKGNSQISEYYKDMFNESLLLFMYYVMFYFVDGGIINGTPNGINLQDQIEFKNQVDFCFVGLGMVLVLVNFFFFSMQMKKTVSLQITKFYNFREFKKKKELMDKELLEKEKGKKSVQASIKKSLQIQKQRIIQLDKKDEERKDKIVNEMISRMQNKKNEYLRFLLTEVFLLDSDNIDKEIENISPLVLECYNGEIDTIKSKILEKDLIIAHEFNLFIKTGTEKFKKIFLFSLNETSLNIDDSERTQIKIGFKKFALGEDRTLYNTRGARVYYKMMESMFLMKDYGLSFNSVINKDRLYQNQIERINIYNFLMYNWKNSFNLH